MFALLRSPLFIALALAALTVVSGDSRNIEHAYWNPWFKLTSRQAPDTAVIVSLDGGSAEGTRRGIASTNDQAALLSGLLDGGVERIYLDFPEAAQQDPAGDRALAVQIARAGDRVVMVNRARVVPKQEDAVLRDPTFAVPRGTQVAFSSWSVNFASFAVSSTATVQMNGKSIPALSLFAAGSGSRRAEIFPDFSIDPRTIPVVDARAVLAGNVPEDSLRGKQLYLTGTAPHLATNIGYFGHYVVPMAAVDIAAADALANGKGIYLGLHLLLIGFVVSVLIGRRLRSTPQKVLLYGTTAFALFVLPGILRNAGYVATIGDAHIAAIAYTVLRGWEKWRDLVRTTSSASGLPNIEALSAAGIPDGCDVVAVSVSHYEQMLASLPRDLHGECARQIARRLSVAAAGAKIYDNDNGHFVWLVQPFTLESLVAQFKGLKALFSAPLVVGGQVLDTNVHFGLDRNSGSNPANRIRSAIVCSSEAQSKGKLYEEFGQQRLAQAPWELSLNARIDEGLRNGDIWLAFQPQYDLRKERVGGAETLIRWTDPERGVIPPDSFIIQAERAGRIDSLTFWVLEKTIAASCDLDRAVGEELQLSVNLSAWMVDQPGLISHVSEIVRRSNFDCRRLTFEVTETFSMANREAAKHNLGLLRAMGFRLSIDDFGTGQASLSYLAEIPSDEIKLDRRFVQAVNASSRDRAIVASTIQLAHALGQEIVAEGVEDLATLRTLQDLGCDIAQGYLLGRPAKFEDFLESVRIRTYPNGFAV